MELSGRAKETLEFLDRNGIGYTLYTHPPLPTIEEALKYWENIDSTHCKNLFFRNHKGNRHYLVVFECHKDLDIHSLEHKLKQGKLSFASAERMQRCLGLQPGSVSPLGLIRDMKVDADGSAGEYPAVPGADPKELFPNGHRVKLFLDRDLAEAPLLSFHPCDNRASVTVPNADFMRFLAIWGGEYEFIEI